MNTVETLPDPALDPANSVANPQPADELSTHSSPPFEASGEGGPVAPEPGGGGSTRNPQPTNELSTRNSQLSTPSTRPRNGKVARLPKEIRTRINQMLDDGLPYHQVLENLGEHRADITVGCIGSWRNGGYRDYLREQQLLDEARVRQEFITDFAREDPSIDAFQAAHKLAAALICQAIAEFGSQTFHDAVKANPLNLLRMLNALSRITAGGLKCQQFLANEAERLAKSPPDPQNNPGVATKSVGLTEPAVAELNQKLNLM